VEVAAGGVKAATTRTGTGLSRRHLAAALDASLGDDETRLLDAASDPGAPDYPYGERGQSQRGRRVSGGRF
jgi:hypothetical protein